MKVIYAGVAAIALLAGQALAADTAPLAPGKPAGVKKAQDEDTMTALYIIGGGALVAGIAVLASDDNNNNTTTPPPTTTTTSTST
jgi:hypothetical protein